jgi:hypothetical protein
MRLRAERSRCRQWLVAAPNPVRCRCRSRSLATGSGGRVDCIPGPIRLGLVRKEGAIAFFTLHRCSRIAVIVVNIIERFVAEVDIGHFDIVIVKVPKLLERSLQKFVFVQAASDSTFAKTELSR